jgi:hypothetical protein
MRSTALSLSGRIAQALRGGALSLWFAIGALAFGCELDTEPGQGLDAIGMRDGEAGAAGDAEDGAGGKPGPFDLLDAGRPDAGKPDAGKPDATAPDAAGSPCGDGCPDETPVCLAASGDCVQCARNRDCSDPELPVCDPASNRCVQCAGASDCNGDAPVCAPDTHECVQCAADADCGESAPRCDPSSHTCVACLADEDCGGDTPICELRTQTCVQCVQSTDCASPEKPQCGGNTCGACTGSAACAGRADATVCDLGAGSATAGQCVQCTVMDESPCAGHACEPVTKHCTDRPLASKHTCEPCIADSECVAGHRCIALQFAGAPRANAYCMRQLSTGCAPPFMSAPLRRGSRSGAAPEDFCGINEQNVTCEAIAGLVTGVACPGGTDAECGRDGSLCRTVNGGLNYCTYACTLAAQCPAGVACGSSYCGGP